MSDSEKRAGIDEPFVLATPITQGRSIEDGPLVELMFEEPNLAQLREIERSEKTGLGTQVLNETLFQLAHPWGQPERALTRKQIDLIKSSDLARIQEALEVFLPKAKTAAT